MLPPQNTNVNGQVYIKVKNLYAGSDKEKTVCLPEFKHGPEEDAGADVRAINRTMLRKGSTIMIPLGFSLEIPRGYEVQVRSRSGLSRSGIVVANSPGTIDSGYRGECCVLIHNGSSIDVIIEEGERIAQFVLNKVPIARYYWDNKLSKSNRAEGGFGSTGMK